MRFGGHETFSIREGWLHKGLKLLVDRPNLLVDEYAADWLGVGRNMAKSIRYWLLATGLAEPAPGSRSSKLKPLQPTEFAHLVWNFDPYFTEAGTWWALHVNLVNASDYAATWVWFFNSFNVDRFERSVCLESLRRYLQLAKLRSPSARTLARDISCLLGSYARTIPQENIDPEEAYDCPFIELRLISYFKTSGYYQLYQGVKDIPPEVFGYCMSRAFSDSACGDGAIDIGIHETVRHPGSPGRVFALGSEALFEVVSRIETERPDGDIQIAGLAGSRVIRLRRRSPLHWMEQYYISVKAKDRDAA